VSSSPKNFFEVSGGSSNNREFLFNSEEEAIPNSSPQISNQNESGFISNLFAPNRVIEEKS